MKLLLLVLISLAVAFAQAITSSSSLSAVPIDPEAQLPPSEVQIQPDAPLLPELHNSGTSSDVSVQIITPVDPNVAQPNIEQMESGTVHTMELPQEGDDGTMHTMEESLNGDGTVHTMEEPQEGDGTMHTMEEPLNGDGTVHTMEELLDGDNETMHTMEELFNGNGTVNTTDVPLNGNETVHTTEVPLNGNGTVNTTEAPLNGNETVHTTEVPLNGNGTVYTTEAPLNGNGTLNTTEAPLNGNGTLFTTEVPLNGNGTVNTTEAPLNGNGTLNTTEAPLNGNGTVYTTEVPLSGNGTVQPTENSTDDGEKLLQKCFKIILKKADFTKSQEWIRKKAIELCPDVSPSDLSYFVMNYKNGLKGLRTMFNDMSNTDKTSFKNLQQNGVIKDIRQFIAERAMHLPAADEVSAKNLLKVLVGGEMGENAVIRLKIAAHNATLFQQFKNDLEEGNAEDVYAFVNAQLNVPGKFTDKLKIKIPKLIARRLAKNMPPASKK
uniref:Uncharacterized protein n=1 Tax=Plectus sambesii TaxID=2011161 RepID=A0A914UKG6_9BILA